MNKQTLVNNLATELLQDIEVAYGYAHPDRTRRRFDFLQPHYADSRETNLIERILVAYRHLHPDKKTLFREALLEAMERRLADFQGSASRLLGLLDLNYHLNPDALNSHLWARLINCRNESNPQMDARLIEGLIKKFRDWNINPDIRSLSWKKLLNDIPVAELPSAGEWLLGLAKSNPEESVRIFEATWTRVQRTDRRSLNEHWPDRDEIYGILFLAFLPNVPEVEKLKALRDKSLPTSSETALSVEDQRDQLIDRCSEASNDWPDEDIEYERKHCDPIRETTT